MVLVLIFPALMLLVLAGVAVLALDKPVIEGVDESLAKAAGNNKFDLAA